MLTAAQRHLYRDRRRLGLSWGLLVAANVVGANTLVDPMPWMPAELALSLIIFCAVPLVSVLFKRHRNWTEVVALATFAFLVLGRLQPGSPFDHTGPQAYSPASWALYGALIWLSRALIYGRWSDRFTPRGRFTIRSRLSTPTPVKQLWYGLVPTPGQLDHSPDPEVVSIDYADAARRTVRLVTWLPPRGAGELLLHIHDIEPFRRIRLSMETLSGPADEGTRGETELEIIDLGHSRRVRMSHTYLNGFPPRRLLQSLLDDTFGRMMDARLDAIELNAACPGSAKAKVSFDSWYPDPHDKRPNTQPNTRPETTPTAKPLATPTATPTANPTATPTATPTAKPLATPAANPTAKPTAKPTANPIARRAAPSVRPSLFGRKASGLEMDDTEALARGTFRT